MKTEKPPITPQMKVGELLENYPELENSLISLTPAFAKLKNPVLRRTLAKITSLSQAARVGGVTIAELIGRLRTEAGLPEMLFEDTDVNSISEQPKWFDSSRIVQSLDARAMIEAGEHPLGQVLAGLEDLPRDAIYELITPFEPAPLIDKVKARGFMNLVRPIAPDEYRTYFCRKKENDK